HPAMSRPPVPTDSLYRYCSRADAVLRLGVRNAMFLTPYHGNLSQSCITIPIPLFGNSVCMNPVFEVTERASPTYGITQIISYVLIVYREAEPLHDAVFMNLKSVRQREIVIRCDNVLSHANRVMLPFWKVVAGCVILRST